MTPSSPWMLVAFLAAGLLFGMLSFSHRHRFSEGVTRPGTGADARWGPRLGWMALSLVLWPLLLFTGAAGWYLRPRVRHDAAGGSAGPEDPIHP